MTPVNSKNPTEAEEVGRSAGWERPGFCAVVSACGAALHGPPRRSVSRQTTKLGDTSSTVLVQGLGPVLGLAWYPSAAL